jgi:hypothetical protein
VNTNEDVRAELEENGYGKVWIKRGDFHAMHKEDVSYCRHSQEAQEVLHEYFYRGIRRAVINKHLEGDLIKFYGVQGQPWFFWFYPFDDTANTDTRQSTVSHAVFILTRIILNPYVRRHLK